jgi:hypothetical protein
MAAALFPTALKMNQSSVNDTLGPIICDSGLKIARSQQAHKPGETTLDQFVRPITLADNTNIYPQYDANIDFSKPQAPVATKGFLAFYQYLGPVVPPPMLNTQTPPNDYRVIVVAYNVAAPGNTVTTGIQRLTVTLNNGEYITQESLNDFREGMLLINAENGLYARIAEVRSKQAVLNALPTTQMNVGTQQNYYLVRETTAAGELTDNAPMAVLSVRTSLPN